jgi:hypothetical protein
VDAPREVQSGLTITAKAFSVSSKRPAVALAAFLEGKAAPSASPQAKVLPKMLQHAVTLPRLSILSRGFFLNE